MTHPAARGLSSLFIAAVLAMLLGMQPLSTDLMLPALPLLGSDLHASTATVQLTMSAMILAFGLAQLVWGPLADRFGRRPVLLAGLALYAVAGTGAAVAADAALVVAWRTLMGVALAVPVVCARATVRDLFEPGEGAMVMARALSGLGVIAIASPLVGGMLVAALGWRAAMAAMALAGAGLTLLVWRRWPETNQRRSPQATQLGPLVRRCAAILGHPGFRAWALLTTCTYAGIYTFLASSGYVLIRVLGLSPLVAGLVMCTSSVAYILGTFVCRRWLPRVGLVGSVMRGAWLSVAAAALMALVAITDVRSVWAIMVPVWIFALAHGIHQPCGQAGVVGPFPHAAGLASALAGFVLAAGAFGVGLWLGVAIDGTVRPLAQGIGSAAALTALVAWTLVRRHGASATTAAAPSGAPAAAAR